MPNEQPSPVTVHMVGNAHIDPIWLWPMSEGRAEVLSTYRTALALIDEFDGYVFTSGGAITYQWAAEDDPVLFRGIQRAVAEGRWELVNGWWLQPDCNIPHGEAFARHALYGQRYLLELFGRRATIGYNVDSFGHAGTLPQILKQGGLDHYVFFRPKPDEKDLPREPFWWQAPDGTRVLAQRPPLHYNSPEREDMRARVPAAAAGGAPGLPAVLCFYGVGNHGGGPTRHNVCTLVEMMAEGASPRPVFSSPERYFAEIEALGRSWPVVAEELQHHSRGCYTAVSRVKRENRQAEHALLRAERLAALAGACAGLPSRQEEIAAAWKKVLFCQFHDVLPGTSIRSAYEDVWDYYDQARRTAAAVEEEALAALGRRVRVPEGDQAVTVWNSLPWERDETVRLRVGMGGFGGDRYGLRYPAPPRLVDEAGREVPCQIVDVELDYSTYMVHLDARVTVPALGWRVLQVTVPVTDPPAADPEPPAVETVDNGSLRLRFDPATGWLLSLADVASGAEYLAGPAAVPVVLDDHSDTWSHGVAAFRDEVGRFTAVAPPQLVHDGPVQRTVRVTSAWGASTIVQEFTLAHGRPEVDVTMTIDWHEQFKMLKLAFPLALDAPGVTASAPYGSVGRTANGEEEPCQAWVDLSDASRGVTLLNDSRYGYDALGAELRLSVLRSPIYAFHDPRQVVAGVTYHYTDQGLQTLRYRLLPHEGAWQAVHPGRAALELHEPLIGRAASPQGGERPQDGEGPQGSLLRVAPQNAVLTVAKWTEDGGGLLVRGYEAEGRPTRVVITSEALGRRWEGEVRAHQIWSWLLPLDGGAPVPTNFLEDAD